MSLMKEVLIWQLARILSSKAKHHLQWQVDSGKMSEIFHLYCYANK